MRRGDAMVSGWQSAGVQVGPGIARDRVTVQAAQSGRAYPLALLIGDNDVVCGHRATAVDQCRYAGNMTSRSATVVGSVDLDANGYPVWTGMQRRAKRAKRLREDARGSAVQQAHGLRIAFDRHRSDDSLGRGRQDLDPHTTCERIRADVVEPIDDLLRALVGPQHKPSTFP